VSRCVQAIAARQDMIGMKPGPARVPLIAPSILRVYGVRTAAMLLVMLLAVSASTFMLREAATARIIGSRGNGDSGPTLQAALNKPGGLAVDRSGDVFLADSDNHVILRIDAANNMIPIAGDKSTGFGGDFGSAKAAQFDTPDGLAIAPDGDLIVADSRNNRLRRIDRDTQVITTIAGNGESGYNGDEQAATDASLNNPGGIAVAANGDIYIADTLNHRVRMIDHVDGFIHTVAGDGTTGDGEEQVGDGGPATGAPLNMPSDVAVAPNGDVYIADMYHQRVRKIDAMTRRITTVAGTGHWGNTGDDGPATRATFAGPAGIAVVADGAGGITLFIADYYNGRVRVVGPDGIIRAVDEGGAGRFGAPTRVAYEQAGGWLYVADASRDRVVALNIAKSSPTFVRVRPSAPAGGPRRVQG
jgi:DNA-binding beta-propeller fold protein YncE